MPPYSMTSSPDNVEQHVGILSLDVLQGPSKGVLTKLMCKGWQKVYATDIADIQRIVTVHCQISKQVKSFSKLCILVVLAQRPKATKCISIQGAC